jgi:citrate lyase beta subunit
MSPLRTLRTPAHVLYGGAHLYRAGTPAKLAKLARSSMETWGADDMAFASSMGLREPGIAGELARRVRAKLEDDGAVEKMCIDFEDGYGPRRDDEEDGEAVRTADELAVAMQSSRAGPVIGIRIKALAGLTSQRAKRTLDLFLSTLAASTKGALPEGFTVTLPKVASADEVTALADQLDALEAKLGVAKGLIGIELGPQADARAPTMAVEVAPLDVRESDE